METWEEATATVKQQSDIVQVIGEHVNLKRSGVRYLGLCPFHQEKTPSFSVHPGQQFYYCFGCGAAGDVFNFVMNYHHLEFKDALKMLADRCSVELPQRQQSPREAERQKRRELLFAVNRRSADIYRDYLCHSPGGAAARRYLQQRGISEQVQERYQLGYAPSVEQTGWHFLGAQLDQDEQQAALASGLLAAREQGGSYDRFRDRIMCPIFDAKGRIAGFGGRILGDGNPKYLNSPESEIYIKSRLLFGLYQQRDAIRSRRRATLVEGNFDLLSLVTHGYESVVAPLGTALTGDQVRLLKGLADEVVLLFDGDEAGIKAAERAVPLFLAERVSGRVALLPVGEDPDTYIRQHGAAGISSIVEQAETLPEFALKRMVERHGLSLDGKTKIVEELKPLLAAADSTLQRSLVAAHFSSLLGVPAETLLAQVAPASSADESRKPPSVSPGPGRRPEPVPKGMRELLAFMIFKPDRLADLEQAGATDVLSGSIGEIIVLQLKRLVDERGSALQPEELLSSLPEGEERSLVASVLLDPTLSGRFPADPDQEEDAVQDIIDWVRRIVLTKRSDALMNDLGQAQRNNDYEQINSLMRQKMVIDAELKAL
ncbi:MAG: DNA primase [Desulfofustis sp.]|jgi:DNA primase|nr:DNA primase [Desulfofustis sp.]